MSQEAPTPSLYLSHFDISQEVLLLPKAEEAPMSYSGLNTSSHTCSIQVSGPRGLAGGWYLYSYSFSFPFRGHLQFYSELIPCSGQEISPVRGRVALLLIFGGWVPNGSHSHPGDQFCCLAFICFPLVC